MKSNQSKAKKIYNAVSTVIVALIFVFMIVVVVVMLVQKNNGGETELFGYRMYDVLTDSMSGTIEPGDVIMCKSVEDVNALQVGDIITFKAPNGNYNETHRIIEIVKNDDGTVKYFKTKGDNAKEADKWELAPENVKAKYVKKSVFIGGLRRFMSHWYGYVAVVVIPLCIVFALIIASFVRDKVAIETEKKKENRKNISAVKENVSAWERVLKSREKERPVGKDYIDRLFTDFVELHGDRYYKDDPAVVGGIAYFHGKAVTVIAQCKGKTTKENLERNFAMPSPEGYRKALRLMKQAEKFQRPVICFVDTPGAFCGMEAEERGQGEAIARNLYEMSALKVPVLSIVIGEGGSGGALALAVADEVWMMENAVYSVLSPEGFASILWKDSKRASEAAGVMRLTAADLKELKVIEEIICEPEVYREDTMVPVLCELEEKMEHFLEQYGSLSEKQLTDRRYDRFRRM